MFFFPIHSCLLIFFGKKTSLLFFHSLKKMNNNIYLAVTNRFNEKNNSNINQICSWTHRNILHWASIHGNLRMMNWAIENKIQVNLQCKHGNTALHEAVIMRENVNQETRFEMIRILLSAGVDMTIRNSRGQTALVLATCPEVFNHIVRISCERLSFIESTLLCAELVLDETILRETNGYVDEEEEDEEEEEGKGLEYIVQTPDREPFLSDFATTVHNSQQMWENIIHYL